MLRNTFQSFLSKPLPVAATFAVALTVSGCNFEIDSSKLKGKITINDTSQLRCTANLPNNLNGIVDSGVNFPITITASGGAGQYQINASGQDFGSQITVIKSFTNSGSENEIRTDTVQVRDSSGLIAECRYQVTVRPDTNPSDLACSVSSGIESPRTNQYVPFVVTATGGTGMYTFQPISLGSDGTIHGTPISNATNYYATGRYATSGIKTVSMTVSDGSDSVTCSRSLTVRNPLQVTVIPTPSASVRADQTITLTASSDGFQSAPTFSFSSSDSGAILVAQGNVATVSSANQSIRSIVVTVTATQGTESVSQSTTLNFTALPALTCTLRHDPRGYRVNDPVTFSVTANTGEAVEMVSFYAGASGTVQSSTANTRTVTYQNPGFKTPWAIAKVRRGNTDVYCQYGDYLYDSIIIDRVSYPLACNVVTSPNPSYSYETVYIDYHVTQLGAGGIELQGIKISGQPFYSQWVYFYQPGIYPIEVKIRDAIGTESTCQTQHLVY